MFAPPTVRFPAMTCPSATTVDEEKRLEPARVVTLEEADDMKPPCKEETPDVAVKLENHTSPSKYPLPPTENKAPGEVVPMPTLPPMNVAEIGPAAVVDATNEEMGPRENIPPKPAVSESK